MRQNVTVPLMPEGTGLKDVTGPGGQLIPSASGIQAGRSSGQMVAVPLVPQLGPITIDRRYTLLSVSFLGYLVLWAMDDVTNEQIQIFGRFGSIQAGLFLDEPQPIPAQYLNQYGPLENVPRDSTLTATIWDPPTSSMPPLTIDEANGFPGTDLPLNNMLPIGGAVSPPVPIDLYSATSLYAAMWMNQSVLGGYNPANPFYIALCVTWPTALVNYDDGL